MYLFERLIWSHRVESREKRDRWDEVQRREFGSSNVTVDPNAKVWSIHDLVDVDITDADSLYSFGEHCLDVRAAFQEEKRGLITFGFLGLAVGVNAYMFYVLVFSVWKIALYGYPDGTVAGADLYVAGLISTTLWLLLNYVIWKYAWRWIRVELFTQRHLIARFNRKTRQVYLNRPIYAGGNVVLDWDSAVAAIDPNEPDHLGMGGFLVLVFSNKRSPSDFEDVAFLGRPMSGNREIEGFWEYIRRYMEDGPEAVPKPKRLLPLWPSPVDRKSVV